MPRIAANRLSPAQNEGKSGVTGDCRVAKNAVTSGSASTRSRRSGCTTRSSRTIPTANSTPMSIEHVARALGGEDADQEQGDHGSQGGRDQHEGDEGEQAGSVEERSGAAHGAHGQEHRQQEGQHHPRGLRGGLGEARVEEPARVDGRGEEQAQVLREEEGGERGDEGAEGDERQEGQEQPGKAQAHQEVAELLVAEEVCVQEIGNPEERGRDQEAQAREERGAQAVARLAPPRAVLHSREHRGEQPGEGADHRRRQRPSSISCSPLPPVSFRNTGVSCSCSPPAMARSSATVPRAMILPARMMLMLSHISWATSRV